MEDRRRQAGFFIFLMRIIGHIDMDAFFASVEERDHEWLRGLPIVVGADPEQGQGRGVVSTANYKAREYGICSAMPIQTAWRNAEAARLQGKPPVTFLAGNYKRYSEVSDSIFSIVRRFTNTLEEASIDEGYFDLAHTGSFEKAREVCIHLKETISRQVGLTASIGIGPNKFIAKIASDYEKPNGLTVILPESAEQFLEPLAIRVIPGIGPKTEFLLTKRGIKRIRDIKQYTEGELYELLGIWGIELYAKARGYDECPLEPVFVAKSISEQETFPKDTRNPEYILDRLRVLSTTVFHRFTRSGFSSFRAVGITVRFADFTTHTRVHTLPHPIFSEADITHEALKLLLLFLDTRKNPHKKLLRLIGIKIEKLK